MALRIYHDANGAREITDSDPDIASGEVQAGQTWVVVGRIYVMSDDPDRYYKNVTVRARDAPQGVTVEYSRTEGGGYSPALSLPDGRFLFPSEVWRRIIVQNAQPYQMVKGVFHRVTFHEFLLGWEDIWP